MFKLIYKWTDKLKNKLNEKGQGMVEYAIVLAAIVAIAVAALWGTGNNDDGLKKSVTTSFDNAKSQINKANENTTDTSGGSGGGGGTGTGTGTGG